MGQNTGTTGRFAGVEAKLGLEWELDFDIWLHVWLGFWLEEVSSVFIDELSLRDCSASRRRVALES